MEFFRTPLYISYSCHCCDKHQKEGSRLRFCFLLFCLHILEQNIVLVVGAYHRRGYSHHVGQEKEDKAGQLGVPPCMLQ